MVFDFGEIMQLEEFKIFVESNTDKIKAAHPSVVGNWEYEEHLNAFTATCESNARLLKGKGYQIHLWKDENIASILKLPSVGRPTKLEDLAFNGQELGYED